MIYVISYLFAFSIAFIFWKVFTFISSPPRRKLVSSTVTIEQIKEELLMAEQEYAIINYVIKWGKKSVLSATDEEKEIIERLVRYKCLKYINDKQDVKSKRNALKRLDKRINKLRSAKIAHDSIVRMTYHLEYDGTGGGGRIILEKPSWPPPPRPPSRKQR